MVIRAQPCIQLEEREAADSRGCDRGVALSEDVDPVVLGRLCPEERAAHESLLAAARVTLGESAFAAAWDAGRALALGDAVELAG